MDDVLTTRAPRRRRMVAGSAVAIALVAALGAVMFPLRDHLSVATTALVLVVPVVAGAAVGGFPAGVVATVSGFLTYDFVFIPPYGTLSVGAAQNWTALAVYSVVAILVARIVTRADVARAEAQARAGEVRRLFDLSELLVRDSSVADLLHTVVVAVRHAFGLDGAALLLPVGGHVELVASDGTPLTDGELRHLSIDVRFPVSLERAVVERGGIQVVALSGSGRAIGLLALRGLPAAARGHELLRAFTNHIAAALERVELHEQALQAQLLEETDRLRRSMVGAVSHDLRTPLATIKVSASTLLDRSAVVSAADTRELLELIDVQADRLERLVANLLDMTRIQSGVLELRRRPTAVAELVDEALSVLGRSADTERVHRSTPPDLPLVDVDRILIRQVLANLIDNASRYTPSDGAVTIAATAGADGTVTVSVSDDGPGVPPEERTSIFQMLNRREAGGRGGLGLAIAQAFVEVHGERIWVEGGDREGACFAFTLPVAGRSGDGARARGTHGPVAAA